jgi:hypothetical protein
MITSTNPASRPHHGDVRERGNYGTTRLDFPLYCFYGPCQHDERRGRDCRCSHIGHTSARSRFSPTHSDKHVPLSSSSNAEAQYIRSSSTSLDSASRRRIFRSSSVQSECVFYNFLSHTFRTEQISQFEAPCGDTLRNNTFHPRIQ